MPGPASRILGIAYIAPRFSQSIVIRKTRFWREESAFSNSKQLQIPRYARNDNLVEVSQYFAILNML